jgi:hypothetical protein
VTCWHMNECESAAMWKLYSTAKESVCVQTTYGRLRSVLDEDVGQLITFRMSGTKYRPATIFGLSCISADLSSTNRS